MIILAIETSCDETAAAVIRAERESIVPLSSVVSSQVKLHAKWGGIVPSLAAREHLKNIIPVIKKSIKNSGIKMEAIDLIAVTAGPGLIPALLVGVNAARTLSYLWKKPLVGIHHIEGHIYANFIRGARNVERVTKYEKLVPRSTFHVTRFPILCLVVSGGHTQLVLMKKHLSYEIVGQTLDDAAGEAFDKVARILGLGYPGGPIISSLASTISDAKYHLLDTTLPRPMIKSNDFNFSFSGLKTAVLYLAKKNEKELKNKRFIAELSHEFQQAVIDVLVAKTIRAAKKYKPRAICISGGVSANLALRKQLGKAVKENFPDTSYMIPDASYSIDNAAMIAAAAYFRSNGRKSKYPKDNWKKIQADANMKMG
jgi:N6-L-threonylcarbamoyladenine synthase